MIVFYLNKIVKFIIKICVYPIAYLHLCNMYSIELARNFKAEFDRKKPKRKKNI